MVLKEKVKIEICEADPFIGCCGPGRASSKAAEELRGTLIERNKTVNALREEFKEDVEIERLIISRKKAMRLIRRTFVRYFKLRLSFPSSS